MSDTAPRTAAGRLLVIALRAHADNAAKPGEARAREGLIGLAADAIHDERAEAASAAREEHERTLKERGWLDEYEAATATAMSFGEGKAEARAELAAQVRALRALNIAVGDYIWLVSSRNEHGHCRLCGATEGMTHSTDAACGAIWEASMAVTRLLAPPVPTDPEP